MSKRHLVVAGATLAAALTACQPSGPSGVPGQGTAAPTFAPAATASGLAPTTTAAAPTAAAVDLTTLAFGADDAPPGMALDETIVGRDALTVAVVSGRDAEFQALDGFVYGRASLFSGDAGALLTAVLAFDSGLTADIALHAFQRELISSDGYGFTDTERNRISFESLCGTGTHPQFEDLIENICISRTGTVTFLVGGPIPMSEVLAISKELSERAMPLISEGP
jgi:hypothetical protein